MNLKVKKIISFSFLVLISLLACKVVAQGYKIDVKIKGAENLDAQFAYYQGDQKFVVSNEKFDKSGKLTVEGEKHLPSGIYFIVVGKLGYFDLLIRDEQKFTLKSDTTELVGLMKIKGSKENEIFYNYQQSVIEKKKIISHFENRIKILGKGKDSINIYKNLIKQYNRELEKLIDETKKKHPNSYLAKLLAAMSEQNADNFKFDDEDLLRTPFFHNMIRLFIKKYIEKKPSYIIHQTKKLLSTIRHQRANYQYIANYLLNFYNTFYKIGMNEVFVFIADNYFLPDKATWFNQKQLDEIQKRRDFLAQSLPGKPAQDLTLESTTGEFFSLHQMESNLTLLYFWSADCGHCTESTKILKSYYEQLKPKNIVVFAVNIDKDKKKWLKKVEENETEWLNCYDPDESSNFREKYYVFGSPLLYVIDKAKNIVSRWNGEGEIKNLCEQLVK